MLSKIHTGSALAASFGSRTLPGIASGVSSNLVALCCRLVSLAVSVAYLRYPLSTRLVSASSRTCSAVCDVLRELPEITKSNRVCQQLSSISPSSICTLRSRHIAKPQKAPLNRPHSAKISKHRNDPLRSRGALSPKVADAKPASVSFTCSSLGLDWVGQAANTSRPDS